MTSAGSIKRTRSSSKVGLKRGMRGLRLANRAKGGRHAPWLGEFLNELLAFPNSRHDDQVDSVTQFLGWQRGRQRRRRRISTVAPILVPMEG